MVDGFCHRSGQQEGGQGQQVVALSISKEEELETGIDRNWLWMVYTMLRVKDNDDDDNGDGGYDDGADDGDLVGWLVGFLTSSSTTRLYRGRAPRQSV